MTWAGFTALSNLWLAALAAPLILFYFLKLRRPRQEIPSLVLWRQVLQDNRVNSPFQKFKRNLLLLLQLILLLLVVLAALQPFWRGRAGNVRRLPVLIDTSASMAALDKPGGSTRLAEAKQRVGKIIDGLVSGQELCLISFSDTARQQTGFTSDKRMLRDALDAIAIDRAPSNIEEALRLVQALARTEPFDSVLLFSDGNLPGRAMFDLSFKLDYQRVAPPGSNLGITTLRGRPAVDGGWDVFVQVEGSAGGSGTAELRVESSGQEIGTERLTFMNTPAQRVVFRVPGDQPVSLRVACRPEQFDALESDNVATLELPLLRPLTVYVPLRLSNFRRALAGIRGLHLVPADNAAKTNAVPDDAATGSFDLLITDKADDLAIIARAQWLVGFVPRALSSFVSITNASTQVVDWRRDDPLLQHVEFGELVLLEEPRLAAGASDGDFENAGFDILVHGRKAPLLLRRSTDETLTIAQLFHPDKSTLPYRVAFPILIANVVQAAREQAGLAEAAATDGLLSANETSLAIVEQLQFNENLAVATGASVLPADRALWKPILLVGLGLLLGEWWYFQRKPGGWG